MGRLNNTFRLAIFSMVLLTDCNTHKPGISSLPGDVQTALTKAGPNTSILLEVIEHYSKASLDSPQLQAAYWWFANMDRWYYYQGDLLDKYVAYYRSIRNEIYSMDLNYARSAYGPFDTAKLRRTYDIKVATAGEIEDNIDWAFKTWKEQPWGKDYNFRQFCEYILPFRIKDEVPAYNRAEIYHQYNGYLDTVRVSGGDAIAACKVINNELIKKGWFLTFDVDFLPHINASRLIESQTGSCREQADLGLYVMRSLGIPVSIDFIPQWPTKSAGHTFNAVIDKSGKAIMFGAADDNPGTSAFTEMKKGKVYRYTVEKNKTSLASLKDEQETVPGFLNSPYFIDVTDEYTSCADIQVPFLHEIDPDKQYRHGYLCVFDNINWVPIHWGNVEKDSVLFTKMEPDIVYLPGYFDANMIIPANYPFVLQKDGQLKFLKPNIRDRIPSLLIKRVCPDLPIRLEKLKGGKFQASITPGFERPIDLYVIPEPTSPPSTWNGVRLTDTAAKYRYVRYFHPENCSIGELAFYAADKRLKGKIISSRPDTLNDPFSKEKASDSDPATSFATAAQGGWVGLDFGRPERIDSLRYSPGLGTYGPRYFVVPGHTYELQYWDRGRWLEAGKVTAKGPAIEFFHLPSNALYFIHDCSKKTEERIFTIEKGKQVWW